MFAFGTVNSTVGEVLSDLVGHLGPECSVWVRCLDSETRSADLLEVCRRFGVAAEIDGERVRVALGDLVPLPPGLFTRYDECWIFDGARLPAHLPRVGALSLGSDVDIEGASPLLREGVAAFSPLVAIGAGDFTNVMTSVESVAASLGLTTMKTARQQ